MKFRILTSVLFPAAVLVASCGASAAGDSISDSEAEAAPAAIPAAGITVEMEGGSPFAATARLTLAEGWAIAVEPGTGNLLITEKAGTARYFNPATGTALPVNGLPTVAYGGQGGLGDVAFAPDYATSGTIYLTWAALADPDAPASDNPLRRAVAARGHLACDATACTLTDLTQIWQQEPAIASFGHFSHRLAFSPDGHDLYITSGERMQGDPAQSLDTNLGKVVRLTLDGAPAAGNPFADRGTPGDQIWSYGHRNLLGLQFDAAGNLWDLEHGPRGGDELNLVTRGANYGWPVRSNGNNYDGSDIPDHTADDGFAKPAIFWNPVIAPGDFLFYRGDLFPAWRGQALIAALGVTSVVRVATDAATGTATEEARYRMPFRLRDIAEAADGSLWVLEDGPRGRLMHLTPADQSL